MYKRVLTASLATLTIAGLSACAQTSGAKGGYGAQLEGFTYPYPVQRLAIESQGAPLSMAYMDVAPTAAANGRTVVLLHGKNFCSATWEQTISTLAQAGYRVIAPDQIGFCASSKPQNYQFSFQQLAVNTATLLKDRGVERATIVGHSMGGMLATRFALMYAPMVEQLVMVNPIGLEDYQAAGVPYATLDETYRKELATTRDSIRDYQNRFYYDNNWKPEYDKWVDMLAGMYAGPGREQVADNAARTADMIFTQPVVHEFPNVRVPTVVMIGQRDRSAPGANRAPKPIADQLGNYPQLGQRTAQAIPGAQLVEFMDLGHSPQVESPERFHRALLDFLPR